MAQDAMAIVNEHPNVDVRKLYAGQVATHVGLPVNDLVAVAQRGGKAPAFRVAPTRQVGAAENAEFVAIAMLLQRWDEIAEWLTEELFAHEVSRRAFVAVAEGGGNIEAALALADPEARELLERAAVTDVDAEPVMEARNLIAAATRRLLARHSAVTEPTQLLAMRDARLALELIVHPDSADSAAEALLGWIKGASEELG
jgi:DNA primase